jgi:hypothetical protein
MKASEIVARLPEKATPEREAKIIDFIRLGNYIAPRMFEIESKWGGHVAKIQVMSDALMLGEPDDFLRVNTTMKGEQCIADILTMSLITPKIADLIRINASVVIEPCIQTADNRMTFTSRMVKHSEAVTNAILAATKTWKTDFGGPIDKPYISSGSIGIVSDVGKDWVLSNLLYGREELAANYGWHTRQRPGLLNPKSGPYPCPAGGYMWQTLGTRHHTIHTDYSQVVRLMSPDMIVDGNPMKFSDVSVDRDLCWLVSYEGPLKVLRHPSCAVINRIMDT